MTTHKKIKIDEANNAVKAEHASGVKTEHIKKENTKNKIQAKTQGKNKKSCP